MTPYRGAMLRVVRVCVVGCAAGAAIAASSCSGDGPTGPKFGPPTALLIEGGQDQSGVVATELPTALTVKVVDAQGRPVRGQAVNFRVVSGDGSVFAGVAITSDSGIARERWTLGTVAADSQRVEARAVDDAGTAVVFGVFRATARPDVPASLVKVAEDTQTVVVGSPATDSLAVRVLDRHGNPVPQTTVRWAVTSGGGTLSADSSVTAADGVARTRWTVGQQVGVDQRVTATVGSLSAQTFQATVQAAAAVGVAIVTPAAGAASGAAFTTAPSVRLVDAFGNTAVGSTNAVTLAVSTGGTLSGTVTLTPADGVATFAGVGLSGTVGDYTLTYAATGLAVATQTVALIAGAPTQLVITTQPAGAVSGAPFTTQPVVELRDNAGNRTASTATVTASVLNGTSTLQGTTAVAAINGVATFVSLRIDRAATHVLRFTVETPALSVTAGALSVAAGPAALLELVESPSGSGVVSEPVLPLPRMRIIDAFGNSVPNHDVTLTFETPDQPNATVVVRTDSAGVAGPTAWTLGSTSGWNRLSARWGPADAPVQSFSVYGFPTFTRIPVVGSQPPFTTGISYNRVRDRLTAVHSTMNVAVPGLSELAPDGGSWTTLSTAVPASGRVYTAVHEEAQQLLIISAGMGPSYWDYAAQMWGPATAGDAPSPREYPAMVYDPDRKVVLLYGGIVTGGSSDPVAELYAWDGVRWTNLGEAASGPRAGHSMAYVPNTKRVYVHGGVNQGSPFGGSAVRYTWFLAPNGGWNRLDEELPENVAAAPMAYAENRGTLVLVGGTRVGSGGYGLSDAVWELIDGTWIRSASLSPAGHRVLSGLVYSPSRHGLILFGSEHAGWNDVWFYGPR